MKMKLFKRIIYSLKMGWSHRKTLYAYLDKSSLQIKNVTELNLKKLGDQGIEVLVLDFDGVLGADHALAPADFVRSWLDAAYQYYQDRLFILSNKPLPMREADLKKRYPQAQFIKGVAKKPYPDGLSLIKEISNQPGEKILFCDDRLLTGMLAAELAGVRALWVTEPIRNFKKRFVSESFFTFLRLMDRCFLRMFG